MLHRTLRTVLGGLVITLALGACQQGPGGGGSTSHPHDPKQHTHDPKTITKVVRVSNNNGISTGSAGGLSIATIGFEVPEITDEVVKTGLVEAYTDLGTGNIWYSLPRTTPFDDIPVVTVEFAYTRGTFSLNVIAATQTMVRAAITVMQPERIKIAITLP